MRWPRGRTPLSRLRLLRLLDLHAAERKGALGDSGLRRGWFELQEPLPNRQRIAITVGLGQQQRQVEMGVGEIGPRLYGPAVLGDGEIGLRLVLCRHGEIVP